MWVMTSAEPGVNETSFAMLRVASRPEKAHFVVVITWRRTAQIGAAIAALLVLAPVGLHFYWRWKAARFRAELIRRGEPLTFAQIVPKPPLPDENGGPGFAVAAAQLGTSSKRVSWDTPPRAMYLIAPGRALIGRQQPDLRDTSGKQTNGWEALRAEFDALAPILAQIRTWLQRPAFDFNR